MENLAIKELSVNEIPDLINYWLNADAAYLYSLGADIHKIPERADFEQVLINQINTAIHLRNSYAIIWLLNDIPIGHCNLNPFRYGESGFLHLHIWNQHNRNSGIGSKLLKESIQYFFDDLRLETLYSEPYELNEAPNKTLSKLGFVLEKTYRTIPGSINFEQCVNRWKLDKSMFRDAV